MGIRTGMWEVLVNWVELDWYTKKGVYEQRLGLRVAGEVEGSWRRGRQEVS